MDSAASQNLTTSRLRHDNLKKITFFFLFFNHTGVVSLYWLQFYVNFILFFPGLYRPLFDVCVCFCVWVLVGTDAWRQRTLRKCCGLWRQRSEYLRTPPLLSPRIREMPLFGFRHSIYFCRLLPPPFTCIQYDNPKFALPLGWLLYLSFFSSHCRPHPCALSVAGGGGVGA